jgi:hypothetical protein
MGLLENLWGKDIPLIANCLDELRICGIGFDLSPQSRDLHVNAAVERSGRASPGQIEKLIARQYDLRMLGKRDQQVEFPIR